MTDEVRQEVKQAQKYLLRCKASITTRELGAILNVLFLSLPEDVKRLLEMSPNIEFVPIPVGLVNEEKKEG